MINPPDMEPKNNPDAPMSALQYNIAAMGSTLAMAAEEREQMATSIVLRAIADGINDASSQIVKIISSEKHPHTVLINLISGKIADASKSNISVPHYSQRAGSNQSTWLYVGTHWMLLDPQEFIDFTKACCINIGLDDTYFENPNFMNKLIEQIEFRLSKSWKHFTPSSEALINFKNGTLVIKADGTKDFRDHNPSDYLTFSLPYAYDPNQECPRWHAFLNQMLPEKEAQDVLAEYIAYGFTKRVKIEKMLVLYGRGANGKSVVLDVITSLVGRMNVSNVSLEGLTKDDEKRCMIENKVFNISHESNRELDVSVLKLLVSGEPVNVRELYIGSRSIENYSKLLTSFNILPRPENTHGFYRRFLILPFNVTIDEKEMDVDLAKKLCEELPGILNWVLEAMPRLIRNHAFTKSPMCEDALQKYRLNSDSVLLFVSTCCKIGGHQESGKSLYDAYRGFCMNENTKYYGKQNFYSNLEAIPGVVRSDRSNVPIFNVKIEDYESCRY